MHSFTYQVPTEVVFGTDTHLQAAQYVRKYGGSRVLVIYGGGSAVRSGLLDRVCEGLRDDGLTVETLGGVQPNPRVALVREGVQKALTMQADFILAVGGGSVNDTAKAVAHGAANPDLDVWNDIWLQPANLKKSMAVGAVLTIPAAGSETSDSAVLTDGDSGMKRGLNTQLNRPVFAILDPKLPATLPAFQLGCGVTDIMMHTLDRYFNPDMDNQLTDELAEALLRVVIDNGLKVLSDPENQQAMSEILWAGSLSHNGLTGLGGRKDFAPHQLGHALGGMFDKAHGATLAAIWGSWARYTCKGDANVSRFARYARNVWHLDGEAMGDMELALGGIAATESYFQALGMPTCLEELVGRTLDGETLAELAYQCSYSGTRTIGTFMVLNQDDMLAIYTAANERRKLSFEQ